VITVAVESRVPFNVGAPEVRKTLGRNHEQVFCDNNREAKGRCWCFCLDLGRLLLKAASRNPADISRVLEDTSPSDVRHGVPSDPSDESRPYDPIRFLGERLVHAGQEDRRISSQYADPSIAASQGKASPTMLLATSSTPMSVAVAGSAAAFRCDVLLADFAPSELESMLDRFNGSARLRADPIDGVRHRFLSSPFGLYVSGIPIWGQ
jgi:hypothetical protein